MPESTTSSQGSTPTPYELNGGADDGHWNQVSTTTSENVLQAVMPLDWNELPPHSIVPVPVSGNNVSSEYVTSSASQINVLSNQVVYSPSNYMNAPYQRSNVPIGYSTINSPRGMHTHVLNGHVMRPQNGLVMRPQHGPVMRPQNGPVISGPTWPNQTTPGRYVAQPQAWNNNKPSGGVKKQKRIRTAFTSQQMMELEQEYSRTRYLDRARRIELAEILRLNERTIKIWFQNRRMKEKKDRAESLEDSEEASTTVSSPEMGNIQMPMLIHEQYPSSMKNDAYNQGNIYLEHYPAMSTPISMPVTSLTTSLPAQIPAQNMYTSYIMEEGCQPQYQEVHLQVQPYPSPFSEVQESSSETASKMEAATTQAPSDIIEKSWDLSWIRSVPYEDEY